ncbi:MAG: efflux transporter outer membrane subunit [Desulfovibrionaceae bacterium]|nr:efflux transporter outer membrane subunit [Desulfovibrionaceae bacterium]
MNSLRSLIVLCCVTSMLVGCSLAPKYERPQFDMPKSWRKVDLGKPPLQVDWWVRFTDPVLTTLINEALKHNHDLEISLANIRSAAAQAGVSSAALFPQVTAQGSAQGQLVSNRTANAAFDNPGMSQEFTSHQGTFNASWELDFFGKIRNQYTMLTDVLMNTVISHEAKRLSIAAQTAKTYFALLAADMQLETARRTLKTREKALGIYTSRYEQGDITELDWQRARAAVETARAQLHQSTIAVDNAEAGLAVLLGRSPRELMDNKVPRGKSLRHLPAPPVLPQGIPSQLLFRRPDIRAAEFLIMANNANIGVARARFFPSISLTGMLGTMSASVTHLFSGPAGAWSYGITGNVPLLDFGNNWYNLKDAEARKAAAIGTYRKTVQAAFRDIRTSLTQQTETRHVVDSMQRQVQSLRRAVDIAQLQYDNGYTDYLTVLDAERELFTAELSYATALQNRLNATVDVCQALGGGWFDKGAAPDFPIIDTDKLIEAETNEKLPKPVPPKK